MPTRSLTAATALAVLVFASSPAAARGTSSLRPRPDVRERVGAELPASLLTAGARGLAHRFSGAFHGAACAARMVAFFIHPGEGLPHALLRPVPKLSVRPVEGTVSSPFGVRQDPIRKRLRRQHDGIDFDARRGTMVRAAGPGLVIKTGRYHGYGRVVFIDHGLGVVTRYAHLRRIRVKEGAYVPAGAVIATVGSTGRSTGPHLHFEVRVDGEPVDPTYVVKADLDPSSPDWIDRVVQRFFGSADRKERSSSRRRRTRPSG